MASNDNPGKEFPNHVRASDTAGLAVSTPAMLAKRSVALPLGGAPHYVRRRSASRHLIVSPSPLCRLGKGSQLQYRTSMPSH